VTDLRAPCPGCGAVLPPMDGPIHRYIGASPACWAIYSGLLNGGEPPMAPTPFGALLVDAYAAQHPGTPSAQAIQSVAVHLLTLYGVLERGVPLADALWLRQRALRGSLEARRQRFSWLTPPVFDDRHTVAGIAGEPSPASRAERVQPYVEAVWTAWSVEHESTVAAWYELYVVPERL
jgi:hypothetical protein